jgi:hypothetical protein
LGFQTAVDIANRALQHVGQFQIASFQDNTRQAFEVALCYDKLRVAELRKLPWRCATRRSTWYPWTATTVLILPAAWVTTTAYTVGQLVFDNSTTGLGPNSIPGTFWICLYAHTSSTLNAPGNLILGQPSFWQQYFGPVTAAAYSATVTYNAGDIVYTGTYGSTLTFYISLTNAQIANTPAGGSPWALLNVSGALGTAYLEMTYPWPMGPAYAVNTIARTIYPLPNGYLRITSPDPRQAETANLVSSAGLRFADYQFENTYMLSAQTTPQLIRFVADLSDVSSMDPLFCENLAARIAQSVAQPLTQNPAIVATCKGTYDELFAIAASVNGLEIGSTETEADAITDKFNSQGRQNAAQGRR